MVISIIVPCYNEQENAIEINNSSCKDQYTSWSYPGIYATFGIYLIHLSVMESDFSWTIRNKIMLIKYFEMPMMFIYCLVVLLICYLIVCILRKIPLLKKFL